MDSVSQFVLGSTLFYSVLGKRANRLTPLIGGVIATIPDLDVLLSHDNPITSYAKHRAFSHSIFVLTICAPMLAELLYRVLRNGQRKQLYIAVWLALITHPLLDAFTVYGTQLWWPLELPAVVWSSLFIIDPLFTLPLLLTTLAALVLKNSPRLRQSILYALLLATLYIVWSVYAKFNAERVALQQFANQGVAAQRMLSIPLTGTTLAHRIIVVDETYYYNMYVSFFDAADAQLPIYQHPRGAKLIEQSAGNLSIDTMRWMTQGFYAMHMVQDTVIVTDLRMGQEPNYVFTFAFINGATTPVRLSVSHGGESGLMQIWRRIWDSSVAFE